MLSTKSPAAKFLQSQVKHAKQDLVREFRRDVSRAYLADFVQNGIRPYFASIGYNLIQPLDQCVTMLESWAISHLWIQRHKGEYLELEFLKCFHAGGEEEYNWFCHAVDSNCLDELMNAWKTTEFLDDSDAGYAQRIDFLTCIWQLIDLDASKTHQYWLNYIVEDCSDEEQGFLVHHHEDHAFAGDRRTH